MCMCMCMHMCTRAVLAACLLAALRRQVDIVIYSLELEVGDDALLHYRVLDTLRTWTAPVTQKKAPSALPAWAKLPWHRPVTTPSFPSTRSTPSTRHGRNCLGRLAGRSSLASIGMSMGAAPSLPSLAWTLPQLPPRHNPLPSLSLAWAWVPSPKEENPNPNPTSKPTPHPHQEPVALRGVEGGGGLQARRQGGGRRVASRE